MSEEEWIRTLNSLPFWEPPAKPAVIIAPHPDDETLGAGGLITYLRSRNVEVSVVAVTDGEKAYSDARDTGLASLRRLEQEKALSHLGVPATSIIRFSLPDAAVASCEDELVDRLTMLISPETHVIATWKGDRHPDHEACGRAAEVAALRAGAMLTSYFFWTWHWGDPTSIQALNLRRFSLSDELLRAKSEALLCHESQLIRAQGDPILPDSLLAPARRPFEIFALA